MHFRSKTAFAVAVASLVAVPGVASAATKTVDMGTPISAQKAIQRAGSDANAFFPSRITIHVGDTVKFVPTGFHTVELPGKGAKPTPLLARTAS